MTTYIALLRAVEKVQSQLGKSLRIYAGKAVGAFLRTADEMRTVLKKNPFSDKEPKLTYSFFLHEKPAADALDDIRGRLEEGIRLGKREIYA